MIKLSKAGKRERKLARRGIVRAMPAVGVTLQGQRGLGNIPVALNTTKFENVAFKIDLLKLSRDDVATIVDRRAADRYIKR